MARYQTAPCDYADATLLVLCEQRGATDIFTRGGHFYTYRLDTENYLNLVPGPAR